MANYKEMDDQDFIFVNEPLTEKEEKEFSDFLKKRKTRKEVKQELPCESKGKGESE
jgi:hypothetical protein